MNMNGPLPSVSSLTTAILLKVLADGETRLPVLPPPPASSADMSDQPAAGDGTDAGAGANAKTGTGETTASGQTAPAPRTGTTADATPAAQTRPTQPSPVMAETSRQLRLTMPTQQPLPATMARLWQMLRSDVLPQAMTSLRAQISDTVSQLPNRQQLSQPDGLRQALQASGVFTGSREDGGTAAPDLRQLFSRLAEAIRQQAAMPAPAQAAEPPTAPEANANRVVEHATAAPPADSSSTQTARPATLPGQPGTSSADTAATASNTQDTRQASGSNARIAAYLPADSGDHTLPGRIQPQARLKLSDSDLPLRPDALGNLADQLQGNVARIDTHRLQALQQMDSGHPQWLVELPVRDRDGIDLWQLHIAREGSGQAQRPRAADTDSTWQVTLSFCFGHSGPMVARLRLHGDNLQVTFHSEQADTWQWLQRHTPTLAASLTAAGLHDVQIRQVAGLPRPETLPQAVQPLAAGLKVQA